MCKVKQYIIMTCFEVLVIETQFIHNSYPLYEPQRIPDPI